MNKESMERSSIILANSLHTKKIYDKIYENYSSKIICIIHNWVIWMRANEFINHS